MAKTNKKNIVLLDTHAIIHRAYHALPDFASSNGEPTGALYGLSMMLISILQEFKPYAIYACYDLPKPTYRHAAYDGYKAGRVKTDDELVEQIKRSRDIFNAFSIPYFEKEGFEADDLLGTLVEKLKKEKDVRIIIASGDMDTLQLVDDDKVVVFTLKKGIKDTILYDEKAVRERFGFDPEFLPDFKGLRGDPSDNIIGVKGIGEKTATDLIKEFKTIENIYKILKKDEEKLLKVGIKQRMIDLLKENEEEALFSKMLGTIHRDAPIEVSMPLHEWREGVDVEKIITLFKELEFRTLPQRVHALLGTKHIEEDIPEVEVDEEQFREAQVMLWLLDSEQTDPDLDDILRFTKKKKLLEAHKELLEQIRNEKLTFVWEEIEKPLIPLTKEMGEIGVTLDTAYLKKLSKEYHQELSKIEKEIWKQAGHEFNVASPKQLAEVLFDELKLSVPRQKKTSTGQKSTRESELQKMKDQHTIIELILRHRELSKLLGTYIDALPQMVGEDGRLHAEFLQAGTTTGRMASKNPNLQNIPIKGESGRAIRYAFVAPKGKKLLALDYSQIELRIAAILSEDKEFINIFKEGKDVHTAVAARVFGVEEKDVNKEMRRRAKVINFGILYGMGVNALRENLGTDRKEAQEFYNDYFAAYPTLADYLEGVKQDAARTGYTETMFGRRRRFPALKSKLPFIRAAAERMAMNAPIQGTEADIVKLAQVQVDTELQKRNMKDKVKLILQVHDEIIYEVDDDVIDEIHPVIKEIMESVVEKQKLKGVPILTESEVAQNWGEMK
ncbi:MAG: hypothetical protein COV34_03450 [Candidatus Zambryskibacteria bacterium CG10_big_fil_rev_8_21_14_0_10_42_12]|uniref:DNA-directed DNA polymerase n=1 Tax=Candidatus Zambryskibacteria bacterium CG10_big_fil_rev_8_21_14_0_10_42_12 TaxID=1975115 RepID=A0A2H0QSL2_9BACT|nr:MAG: hypothetical protein COV34_03450 [Candidatus Zambryskibacteria bacterium CG10_big_fil_rev_8_21_14_0_10_42_12]